MGEEEASRSPFLFFSEMNEQLAHSIREGRKREFKLDVDDLPDPSAPETFEASVPQPDARLGTRRFRYYQRLLKLRRERIAPHIPGARSLGADVLGEKAVIARWRLGDGAELTIAINLGEDAVDAPAPQAPLLFESHDGAFATLREGKLAPNATVATLSAAG